MTHERRQADETVPPPRRLGEWVKLGLKLKSGQGITTFEARETHSGRSLIVKFADRAAFTTDFARMRLEHEASLLKAIDHPRVARAVACGEDADGVYLAMERVEGETLATRLQQGPLTSQEIMALAADLTEALDVVHRQGILHRDIKPSNVVLGRDAQSRLRATLIDFGLARSAHLAPTLDEQPLGTAFYVAPEQAGLLDGGVDERSDLYSLGIVLYECAAGTPPYQGERVGDVLRRHLSDELPEIVPTREREAVNPEFMEVIRRLTAKDPRDRYQTAAALRADLDLLAQADQGGSAHAGEGLGRLDRRRELAEPSFIGRRRELATLLARVSAANDGTPALVWVEAPSGAGKSRLLEETKRRARQQGALVFGGIALDQSARRPFQVLAGVVRDAVRAALADDTFKRRLLAHLAERRAALTAALPELASVLPKPEGEAAPEEFGEVRTIEAVSCFLDALGEPQRPALIVLDDCQWADDQSIRLVRHWWDRKQSHGGPCAVVVTAAFRSEEVRLDHPLRQSAPKAHVSLAPLDGSELAELAQSMAGPLPDKALEAIVRFSDGNPFMAAAVLRGLAETGVLKAERDGWTYAEHEPVAVQSSLKAATFLARRIELLDAETQSLLTVAAVLGKEFDLALAATMTHQSASVALGAVAAARRRHIVWETSEEGRLTFAHDKLREALLARLDDGERRSLHGRAARLMEVDEPDRIFELAYHFDQAGEHGAAAPYAMRAARQARAQYALVLAAQQYRIALRGIAADTTGSRLEIEQGLGEVLMLQGLYDQAHEHLRAALELARDPVRRASLETAVGELSFKRGDMHGASAALVRALVLLDRPVPIGRPALLWLHLGWELLLQVAHTIRGDRVRPKRRAMPEATRFACRIYSRLAYAHWFMSGRIACGWAHVRNLNVTERFAPGPERAQAYSEHAPVATLVPLFERGLAYARRSLEIRRLAGDTWGQGQSMSFIGVALYGMSRFRECIDTCTEAARLLERTGDRWEVNTARWHIAYCHYRMGDLREAVRLARAVFEAAQAIGDDSSAGIALAVWSKASGGKIPRAAIAPKLARETGDQHTRAELLQAEAVRAIGQGELDDAKRHLEQAWEIWDKGGLRQEYLAPIAAWMATVLRRQAEERGALSGAARDATKQAARWASRAVRIASVFRNNLPHALREQAMIMAFHGRVRRARRLLARSERVARTQGARAEELETRVARARLDAALGLATNETGAEAALRALQGEPLDETRPRATLSILDRFDGLLHAGRGIIGARTIQALKDALQEGVERLLRCDKALWIPFDGTKNGQELPPRVSRALVDRAASTGRVQTQSDDTGGPSDSLLLSNLRSALCIPIVAHGRCRACLYVGHEQVGRLFGREDERLAGFLGALAGAAVENAESFGQLSAMNLSLEREVGEQRRLADQLRSAKDAADDANRAKSEFLANVSHELRTPLTAINGYAALLEEAVGDGENADFVRVLRRNGDQLLSLVNDILDLAKVESGRLTVARQAVHLGDELDAVVSNLAPLAAGKGLKVFIRLQPEVPAEIVSDALRLRQVLTNVLGNAIKFTDSGCVVVEACLGDDDAADGERTLWIRVRDTGIGIEPKAVSKLFRPFHQVDGSLTRRHGGTGLGLALSRNLARALGGELTLESSVPKEGSTFLLRLPAVRPICREGERPADARSLATRGHRLKGVRVLIAEDNLDNRLLVERVLTRQGATVDGVEDGVNALAAAARAAYDIVLMDLQMPRMDGFEAVRALRDRGFVNPIVALTAHSMVEDREKSLGLGFDDFVTKPLDFAALCAAVARLVRRRAPLR